MSDVRIYVASLSDYNNGILHGVWVDIDETTSYEEVEETVNAMLKASPTTADAPCDECGVAADVHDEVLSALPELSLRHELQPTQVAEEFAIHDYEGFGSYQVDEYAWLPTVVRIGALIAEHGAAFGAYLDAGSVGNEDPDTIAKEFEEAFIGEMTVDEYAQDNFPWEEIPEHLHGYVDVERWTRDLILGGDIFESDGFLFHSPC